MIRDVGKGVRKENFGCCSTSCTDVSMNCPAGEQLRQASSAMLETWSERILTASSLDEVFSEGKG